MDLELRHLRVLCAIADSGSVGRAAAIGASRPATRTQLRRNERHLGTPVFDWTAAGVVPTLFGAEVPAAAREPLARIDRLGRVATPDGGRPHRELRLTADCPALLLGTLARARPLRPELRFALTPPGDAEPPADLALLLDHPGSGLRPTPPLAGRAVATEPVFVALPPPTRCATTPDPR